MTRTNDFPRESPVRPLDAPRGRSVTSRAPGIRADRLAHRTRQREKR
ncbi:MULTISPECIES: hypothetical protein [Arachnia]|uniref:Uncharacterized protein n=1 Tax=Arachnia propionica TaxID=1750 RepID=A0AB37I700_9ACTN|nr:MULTISPECIES: hypothetical protein [Arachnia]QUC11869.1 hypothetical protein J5A53_04015 [Arachnia propionica]QUC13439.1 hypothetical protein J5A61_11260 [Arachnia propionica]